MLIDQTPRSGDLMNTKILKSLNLATMALSLFAFNQFAQAEGTTAQTREVIVGVSDVFVPGGFDSESDAYVVANGMFPNGCYRWKGSDVVNVDTSTHEIKSTAVVTQGMCIMVLVPFSEEIHLGKLQSGSHTLRFLNGDGTFLERSLKVE